MVSTTPAASPLFLREEEVRRGLELLLFGHAALTRSVDPLLRSHDLGRAHQRALYFIARRPGLPVGELIGLLGVTKQSLGRVLNDLSTKELVETRSGASDRRQKLLRLTPAGAALERELFEAARARLAAAYARAGQDAVTGFWRVLEGLLSPGERAWILDPPRPAARHVSPGSH